MCLLNVTHPCNEAIDALCSWGKARELGLDEDHPMVMKAIAKK